MRQSSISHIVPPTGLLLLVMAGSFFTTTMAFVRPLPTFVSTSCNSRHTASSSLTTTTSLFISSWGTKGNPNKWGDLMQKENPEEKVQAYLTEPEAVEARSNIDGVCLVSGLVNAPDRTDQFAFDLLNHEESAFEFEKIVAFVNDIKFSKKRLLSRSARYTGLLDRLELEQADTAGALPTLEQLTGIKSWLACLEVGSDGIETSADLLLKVQQVAAVCKQAQSIENVAILLMGATDMDPDATKVAVQALQDAATGRDPVLQYTVVAVGTMTNQPEGRSYYTYNALGLSDAVLPAGTASFSREESYRLITELLQLECGVNQTLAFREVEAANATEAKLIKGLREAGYVRMQEIDHMIRKGPEAYAKAIDEWKNQNPDAAAGYTTNAWWEAPEFQKSSRQLDEREAADIQKVKDAKTDQIETIAMDWAKREYFRQSMAGTVPSDMSEEEYIKSIWDRAVFEGDLKYRQMNGEVTDPESELENFRSRQARKQQVMLQRAKDELTQILDEENLGGEDLRRRLDMGPNPDVKDDSDDKKK